MIREVDPLAWVTTKEDAAAWLKANRGEVLGALGQRPGLVIVDLDRARVQASCDGRAALGRYLVFHVDPATAETVCNELDVANGAPVPNARAFLTSQLAGRVWVRGPGSKNWFCTIGPWGITASSGVETENKESN